MKVLIRSSELSPNDVESLNVELEKLWGVTAELEVVEEGHSVLVDDPGARHPIAALVNAYLSEPDAEEPPTLTEIAETDAPVLPDSSETED